MLALFLLQYGYSSDYYTMPWYVDLWNTWYDMLFEWPIGTIIAVIVATIVMFIGYLIAWGIFTAIDSWFRSIVTGPGAITDKDYKAGHMSTTVAPVVNFNGTSGTAIVPTYVPPEWSVYCKIDYENGGAWISVSQNFYDKCKIGQKVKAEYKTGRLSRKIYLESIE